MATPLDPAERAEADEARMIAEILAATRTLVARRDGDGPQLRGAHTKGHATLHGSVTIRADLPDALRVGLFAAPGTYEAVMRASSMPDRSVPDRLPNVRGFAVKVLGAPGERLLDDGRRGVDFVCISAETVPFGTVAAFRDMLVWSVEGRGASWFRGDEGRERAKGTAEIMSGEVEFLGLTFYSTTPYRLGGEVVKYRLRPIDYVSPRWPALGSPAEAIRAHLTQVLGRAAARFELAVQRQADPATEPVEDAAVAWTTPWEPVGHVDIPAQEFDTSERDAEGEGLRFDPWHTLPEQRPLGGLNRVRGEVYRQMSAGRVASAGNPPATWKLTDDRRPTCLPEGDFDQALRAQNLADRRAEFAEEPEKLPAFLMCRGAPDASRPELGWSVAAGRLSIAIALNVLANKLEHARLEMGDRFPVAATVAAKAEEAAQAALARVLDDVERATSAGEPHPKAAPPPSKLAAQINTRVCGIVTGAMDKGLCLFEEDFPLYMYRTPLGSRRAAAVDDIAALYRRLPASPAEEGLQDDRIFVRRRVLGPNAPFLARAASVPRELSLPDAAVAAATVPGDTVDRAVGEGRLFLCDYSPLAELLEPKNASDGTPLYAYAPTLVLASPPGGGFPRAVAIRSAPGGALVLPSEGWRWAMARQMVEVADIGWFEPVTHLGLTHLLLEPAALATFRELAPNHPVARLLLPHVEGTISVNDMAVNHLLADGGAIDQTFAATMASIRRVAVQASVAHDLRRDALPALLARQGLDDRAVLPEHGWRDDALRVHGAIGRWVTAYVERAYPDDATLGRDPELRAWAAALGRPGGQGGLTGFGVIQTRADLATVLTELVYLASAGHAAVNFPQWTDASFAARMSGAGWGPGVGASGGSEAEWLAMMPPLEKSELHAEFLYLLGALYHTRLGAYDTAAGPWFDDPVVRTELLPRFQAELRSLEADIRADNQRRAEPYEHLLPSKVPQSINV